MSCNPISSDLVTWISVFQASVKVKNIIFLANRNTVRFWRLPNQSFPSFLMRRKLKCFLFTRVPNEKSISSMFECNWIIYGKRELYRKFNLSNYLLHHEKRWSYSRADVKEERKNFYMKSSLLKFCFPLPRKCFGGWCKIPWHSENIFCNRET